MPEHSIVALKLPNVTVKWIEEDCIKWKTKFLFIEMKTRRYRCENVQPFVRKLLKYLL